VRSIGGFFVALLLALALAQAANARERTYYIAADEVVWRYAPHGMDMVAGKPLPHLFPEQLGWTYRKAIYRQYTDGSFKTLLARPPDELYEGIVGPTIRAEVGDTVVVVFKNNTHAPVDLAPGGIASHPAAVAVAPGGVETYHWNIRETDGPGPHDLSSVLYTYESNVNETQDENAGLIGPLIVTRWGSARADGSPSDVDREIIALYSIQAEARSFLIDANLADATINPKHVAKKPGIVFDLSNAIPSINGYTYGNMPIPSMRMGERVRWYMLSTQNDLDGHAPTWDGQTVLYQGNRLDTLSLVVPHEVADMVPDDPGIWLLVCEFNVHLDRGMKARYRVLPNR
jgi:manganese oxidase